MASLHVPPGEKWSGEQSQISWAYSQKVIFKISTQVSALFLSVFDAEYFEHC